MHLPSTTRERAALPLNNPVAWEKNAHLPRGVAAVLSALQFSGSPASALKDLPAADWNRALAFTDAAGLTLILGATCREHIPNSIRERIDRNLAGNTTRLGRMRAALVEIATQLDERRIEYLLLKGFSHEAEYVLDPYLRMSFDIDLFTQADALQSAHAAICSLGYQEIRGSENLPTDHTPPLIRKTGWQWHGDFFDPGNPGCVDLHFQFWDPATERFEAPGVAEFWDRRISQEGLPVLHPADRLGYTALHLLRHLLRGNVRATHVYEIAYFLHTQAENEEFWNTWRDLHRAPLRRLEAVSFQLAARWFGCAVPAAPREEIEQLGEDVSQWFDAYAASPVENQFHPNKHELWLHFALLESSRDRRRVFVRRILPPTLPSPFDSVFVPDEQMTWKLRARRKIKYAMHLAGRVLHHARALPATLAHGIAWRWPAARLTAPFWRFALAAVLYNAGLFLFYLLYNLYLLDRGYRENMLGLVASAFTAGNLAGVLPAAGLAHRWGLKRTLVICFLGTAATFVLRSLVAGDPALLASAFAGGLFFSLWAVSMSPAVAALSTERTRPTAFSVIFGTGIGLGIVAGVIGGRLPGWIAYAGLAAGPMESKRLALIAAGAFACLALWPIARLTLDTPRPRETRSYPTGPFIWRFLIAIGVWNFATGLFNPLFNAYFSRQWAMPVERIGLVFSISQAAQVAALLLAPMVLRKLGLVRGVAVMQIAAAAALAALASGPAVLTAAALYAGYASFQYMSEPGAYSLLMNRAPREQHSGASAMNFLVVFLAQAAAASAGGAIVAHYGYPPLLAGAAAMAISAAFAFWWLLRNLAKG